MLPTGRLIGIDFGRRRIGLAVADPEGRIATPRETLARPRGKRPPYGAIAEVAREINAQGVVLGLPLAPSGAETEWCAEVRRFGDDLARRLKLPVVYQDERMTSARAEKALRAADLGRQRRQDKGIVDAAAATFILQAWLDAPSGAAAAGVTHSKENPVG